MISEYRVRRLIVGGLPEYARIVEMYSYTTGGLPTKKRAIFEATKPGTPTTYTQYLESQYTYDSEGRRTQMKYPPNRTFDQGTMQWVETPGRQLDYTFDSMGRPNTMTSPDPTTWIGGVTYNAAGQPTNIGGETRQYNTLGQLTRITNGSAFDEEYKYSTTGANNGRITSKKNHLSGEEVEYTYDSLQRLIKAETLGAGGWGSTYGYDGFGNLWSAAATKGYAPPINISINAANNRVVGQTYDANGNQAWGSSDYDVANRLWKAPEGTTPQYYGYDGGNKRVYKNRFLGYDGQTGNPIYDENLTFYGVSGERLGEYTATWESISGGSSYVLRFTEKKTLVWFGSKLLREGQWNIIQDRLGSVRYRQLAVSPFTVENADYYPYGGEKPSATTQGREKFATYLRDETGLDYADQRYHWPDSGRFMSPDPYLASGGAGAPGSWNRYAYVEGDPVNLTDPAGLIAVYPSPAGGVCRDIRRDPHPALTYMSDGNTWCTPEPQFPRGATYAPEQVDAVRNGFARAFHQYSMFLLLA